MMRVGHLEISVVKGNAPSDGTGCADEHSVRAACRATIDAARTKGAKELVMPLFGLEAGFPLIACAKILAQELLRAGRLSRETDLLKSITVVLATDESFAVVEKQVYGYLRHVMRDLAWGPYVTTDIIIEVPGGIIVIERTNPPFGRALPGGFVDFGESLETAARREAKEETNMDLEDLKQFHTYSDPARDPRFHTVTAVFTAKGIGTPCAGDDAKGLKVVPFSQLRGLAYAFDHARVIDDYLRSRGL